MTSIRRRILASLILTFTISIVAATTYIYFQTRHELKEIFETHMRETAQLLEYTDFSAQETSEKIREFHEHDKQAVLQVWDKDGTLLYSMPQNIPLPLNKGLRDSHLRTGGIRWQAYTLQASNGNYIQVARSESLVNETIEGILQQALIPAVFLFALLGFGAWIMIGRTLMPLEALSHKISNLQPDQLQPIILDRVPSEVQPIIQALNELIARADNALLVQKNFTADAAHELRTPLTALRLQIDILKKAQNDQDRARAVEHLESGVSRATRLIQQLLLASRATENARQKTSLDLSRIVKNVASDLAPTARQNVIALNLEINDSIMISGNEESARSIIGNLLDNALRYTPRDGAVWITLARNDNHVILDIEDSGPGIPLGVREKIFERFYRIPGTQQTGSGLGLAIVREAAAQINASVFVANGRDNKGSKFSIHFPVSSLT